MAKESLIKRCWTLLRSPSGKISMGVLLAFGFAAALVFQGTYTAVMDYTNSMEFCVSCHTDDAYPEYQATAHYSNASGVQADCASCHMPADFGPAMLRKVQASKEVWAHLTGKVDTPEKFNAHRRAMAEREWDRMMANDSQECRACHTESAMDLSLQSRVAQKAHTMAQENGETCIQCHKGIAHELPIMTDVKDWN
ncbi:NapC/NirT family cytochrome c [Endozoicomonas lisbonensis]|uniref:Cytochrome c-type protein n=1 Tax=Endozoicomonas lisbonensis TaxID=3120522 RepID=A0ABV2SNT9_9GAMM